jgi:serine/threonine protein kinase
MQDENRITLVENEESETVSYGIPMIEKKDLHYDPKIDEIGRGTFGAVYKASWAGTSVAVKQMKVRQIKLITNILKSEVQVHSKIRHPNIVQIMAVAIGKSAIYIVSELVNGANLEDLLFSDEDDDGCSFTIPSDKKVFIGRQIVQAVAYLHNRKPPILHRDIKPANVLVASESYVTKLCDMGLGKIKSAQTTSHVTSANIAGTPNYMSPECLVEKAKATTKADVWSLACTLVELFTGKDCWGQIEDNFADESEDSSYAICCCLKAKELPRAFQYILTENENLKAILMKCFDYDAEKRPDAIQILDYF